MVYLEYSFIRFIVVLVITLFVFNWIFKKDITYKLYFLPFVFFFFIYSGAGYGWTSCNTSYLFCYSIYIFVFSITCKVITFKKKRISYRREFAINELIERNGDKFIIGYLLLCVFDIAITGKLSNLWSPPSMTDDFSSFDWNEGRGGAIEQLIYYLREIFFIFYILLFYKYRSDTKRLVFFILFPFYVMYAKNAYLARGAVMAFFLIIIVNYCITHPQNTKKVLLGSLLGAPAGLFLLSAYTFIRKGVEFDETFSFAIKLLAYQETCYPLHYNDIMHNGFDTGLFSTYFEWIGTLPLPGFLSPFNSDYAFTARFSEMISGVGRTMDGFNIFLPGIVGEGLYICGYLFPIHALLLGLIVSFVFRIISTKQESFIVMYYGIYAAFVIARGGTVSMYPFYFKHFIIYCLIIYFLSSGKNVGVRKDFR